MVVTGTDTVLDTLKKLYKRTLLPLERYIAFPAPPLSDVDFDALPLVLVVGQYSTGKTTFIRHMLGRDFPSQRVGPEPTTDRFTGIVACYAAAEGVVPGLVAVHDTAFPFGVLDQLGDAFLSRFAVARTDAPLARRVVFLDTPGVSPRSCVVDVARCLARKVDKVVVMFDATKMVLCDEMRRLLEVFADYDEKLLFVLNKSDSLKYHQLMRVYGALMWSLSKVLRSPETRKVFIGSLWERPLLFDVCRSLLESEERDLSAEIENLPHSAAMRKLDAFVARAREVQVYAKAASVLRPRHFSARRPGLGVAFSQLRRLLPHVPPKDFPDLAALRRNPNIRKPRPVLLTALDAMLAHDVPNLVAEMRPSPCVAPSAGHRWDLHDGDGGRGGGSYEALFASLDPVAGKVTGAAAKQEMIKSKLPNSCLRKIWKLADVDEDGMLDITEFATAMHLVELKVAGFDLPYQGSSDESCSTVQQNFARRPRSAHASLVHNWKDGGRGKTTKILDDVLERPERSLTTPSSLKPFDAYRRAQSYDEINPSSDFVESESKTDDKNEPCGTNSTNFDTSDTLSTSTSSNSCSTLIEENEKCCDDLSKPTAAESCETSENTVPALPALNAEQINSVSIPNCPSATSDCNEPHNHTSSTHSPTLLKSTDHCQGDTCCSEAVVGDGAPKSQDSTTDGETDHYQPLDEMGEYRRGPTENIVKGNCDEKLYSGQSGAGGTRHGVLPSSTVMDPSCANDNLSFSGNAANERNENTRDEKTRYKLCTAKSNLVNQCSSSSGEMYSNSLKCGIAAYQLNNERSVLLNQCSSIQKSPTASDECCEEREPSYDIANISEQCVTASDAKDSGGRQTDLRPRSAGVHLGNMDRKLEINSKLSPCCHDNLVRVRFKQNEYACRCEDSGNISKIPVSACTSDANKSPQPAFHYGRRFSRKGEESAQTLDQECEVGSESRWRARESSKLTLGTENNDTDVRFKKISGYQSKVNSGDKLIDETLRSQELYTCAITDSEPPERMNSSKKSVNGISCEWNLAAETPVNEMERDVWPESEPNLSTVATSVNQKSPLHQRKWWTEPRKRISNLFSKYELPRYNLENADTYMAKYGKGNSDWNLTENREGGGDDRESGEEDAAGFNERRQNSEREEINVTQFNRPTQIFESDKSRFGMISDSQDDVRGLTSYWNEGSSDIALSVIRRQERISNAMETATKVRDDDGGDNHHGGPASSSTSWSGDVREAANRSSRRPKRVLLSAVEESFVKNSDFYRFVDELHLSDTGDAYPPYTSSGVHHKSSRGETTWTRTTPDRVNSLGLPSANPSRLPDAGDLNVSYHQHRDHACWHEMRFPKENCGCSDADENRRRDGEEFSSSTTVGGNGDTCDGKVCPERDFNDRNQYRPDEGE